MRVKNILELLQIQINILIMNIKTITNLKIFLNYN